MAAVTKRKKTISGTTAGTRAPVEPAAIRRVRAEEELARRIDEMSVGITPKREAMIKACSGVKHESLTSK